MYRLSRCLILIMLTLGLTGCKEDAVSRTQAFLPGSTAELPPLSAPISTITPTPAAPTPTKTTTPTPLTTNEQSYAGTINGDLPIHMKIMNKDGQLTGSYYYDNYKTNISLTGEVHENGKFNLVEQTPDKQITGSFEGWISPDNRLVGVWSDKSYKSRLIFNLYPDNGSTLVPRSQDWVGIWERLDKSRFVSSSLQIGYGKDGALNFQFEANNGANSGQLELENAAINGDSAVWKNAEVTFLMLLSSDGTIYVTSTNPNYNAGAGVTFDGEYGRGHQEAKVETLADQRVLKDAKQEEAFKKVVGPHYDAFLNAFQLITEGEDLDGWGTKVISGGVRGLFTIVEAIIMADDNDHFWAAVLDNGQLEYYTNSSKSKTLPLTIDKWKERFKDIKVNFHASTS